MRDNITCHKYFIITTQINSSSNDVNNRKNWNETETEIETALRAQKWRERRGDGDLNGQNRKCCKL